MSTDLDALAREVDAHAYGHVPAESLALAVTEARTQAARAKNAEALVTVTREERDAEHAAGMREHERAERLAAELEALRWAFGGMVKQTWPTGWEAKVRHAVDDYRAHGREDAAAAVEAALRGGT